MKNYDTIVDVANTKSYWPGSISLNINDSKIKDYYAIGCRLFQGHYDNNLNKYVKNNSIFFMRKFMVFDFDIDEKHYKPKNSNEKNIIEYGTELDKDRLFNNILENNLKEIYNFLGLPKYEIRNKNDYSKYQIKKYFTNSDGVAKLPKKYGCQIVYELDNPILSQFYEIEKLFKIVSKDITIKFGADEGFTNVLFKNYMNRNLFNVKFNSNYSFINLKDLAIRMINNNDDGYYNFKLIKDNFTEFDINKIFELEPYKFLDEEKNIHSLIKIYSNRLVKNYTRNINTWGSNKNNNSNNNDVCFKNNFYSINSFKSSDSRNKTLFDFLRLYFDIDEIEKINYSDIINSNIFNNCSIKEPLSEIEFNKIKENVIIYRKKLGIASSISNNINIYNNNKNNNIINKNDNRVFKIDQNNLDVNFYNDNKEIFKKSLKKIKNGKYIKFKKNYFYQEKTIQHKIANLFLSVGPEFILSNINNLLLPDMLNFYKSEFKKDCTNLGLWDFYNVVNCSIMLTHFKYYNYLKETKMYNSTKKNNIINRQSKIKSKYIRIEQNIDLKREYGFKSINYYYKNINNSSIIKNFSVFYTRLKNNNLLKENGKPLPVSFYQNYFNISTLSATIYRRIILKYLELITYVNKMIGFKDFLIKNNKNISNIVYIKNTSRKLNTIINNFIIHNIGSIYINVINKIKNKNYITIKYNLFNNKDVYIIDIMYINVYNHIKKTINKNEINKGGNKYYMNILLTDTETTGLSPEKSYILSNGSILYNTITKKYSEFYEVLNWDELFKNNSFIIPEDTIKVHNISKDVMHNEGINPIKSMSNFYKWIDSFCKENHNIDGEDSDRLNAVVAFNLPFDLNMFISNLKYLVDKYCSNYEENNEDKDNVIKLLNLFSKEYILGLVDPNDPNNDKPLFIDSLIIDRIFNFEVDGEKVYHDLQSVGERYGIPVDPNAHNAIADTRRTFKVFEIQLQEIEQNMESLDQNFENRLIRRYNRNQEYWGKKKYLDYLGTKMVAVHNIIIVNI